MLRSWQLSVCSPAFPRAEAVPPEKVAVSPGSRSSTLPASPHARLCSDLPSAAPVITPQPLQLSRELPPKRFKPTGMKQRGANCMSQWCGFPVELSQFGSWLLCPLASGSSPLSSGITETLGHCHRDPHSPGALQRASSGSQSNRKQAIPQKLYSQYRSLSNSGRELPENRSRTTNCTGSAASANQQTWGTSGWGGPPAPHSRAAKPASRRCQATGLQDSLQDISQQAFS